MVLPDIVYSDTEFPDRVSVAVIGGGIVGVAAALELAERGIDTALFEKGVIAGEQSSRNWGWCRQMGRDMREIPLIRESLALWRGMNERVGAETGFRQCGIVYLCETEDELAARARWYENNARPYGLSSKLVSSAEAEKLQPGATRKWLGASVLYLNSSNPDTMFETTSSVMIFAVSRSFAISVRSKRVGLN